MSAQTFLSDSSPAMSESSQNDSTVQRQNAWREAGCNLDADVSKTKASRENREASGLRSLQRRFRADEGDEKTDDFRACQKRC
jgi:hypothetical protein